MATITNFIILLHLFALCFILPLANSNSRKDYNNLSEYYIPSHNIPNNNIPKKLVVMNTIDSCWRNNSKWSSNRSMYAICGSADPTIFSQANYFIASNNVKEVIQKLI